jgi:hypothetical protein
MGRRLHRSSKRYVLISTTPPSCYVTSGICTTTILSPKCAGRWRLRFVVAATA